MGTVKYGEEQCIELLVNKQEALKTQGISRSPQRSDFEEEEVVAIKAFLGPWPRALEKAGLKEPRGEEHLQKNREKRINAKRQRTQARKENRGYRKQNTPLVTKGVS